MSGLERIDFTYWPETGQTQWHAHADANGDPPGLPVSVAEVRVALAAFTAMVEIIDPSGPPGTEDA